MKNEWLLRKAKKGDGEAFIRLVEAYEIVLYRTAKQFGFKDEDIADLLQDTILSAFEHIGTLKKAQYFNTWICRILLNNCYRLIRQNKPFVEMDEQIFSKLSTTDLLSVELDDALNRLKKPYRVALTLYYVNGFTTREISEMLGESEGTIKSRISRARQQLKETYYLKEVHI